VIKPYEKMNVKGVSIETIPAYNTNKFRSPGVPYHPKEAGMVGFIFVANGIRYYHTGDGDPIPEMKGINPDVLFLPVGGRYNMDVDEALEAVKMIGPKVAVPMHFGGSTGAPEDGATFKSKASVPVVVFEPAP
jgi:L-ascorbate metabolism protein UlaG (beta-lactamase superfamily)